MENKNILVIGGTGYLGSKFIEALIPLSVGLYCWKRQGSNLRYLEKSAERIQFYDKGINGLKQFILDKRIKMIIYMACVYESEDNSLEVIEANLNLPFQILDIGIKNGVSKFLSISTSLPENVNLYSLTKRKFGEIGKAYSEKYPNLSFYEVLLESFYGEDEPENRFLSRCILSLIKNEAINLTEGKQHRDYIHIDDVISGLLLILQSDEAGYRQFQLGSGEAPTIREIISYLKEITRSKSLLNFGARASRLNEPNCCADLTDMKSLGFVVKTTWKEGLTRMVEHKKDQMYREVLK